MLSNNFHDDVIKWKHFSRYWPFVRGIHRSPIFNLLMTFLQCNSVRYGCLCLTSISDKTYHHQSRSRKCFIQVRIPIISKFDKRLSNQAIKCQNGTLVCESRLVDWCSMSFNDMTSYRILLDININILNCFKDYKRYNHILNRILDLASPKYTKLFRNINACCLSYTADTMPADAPAILAACINSHAHPQSRNISSPASEAL